MAFPMYVLDPDAAPPRDALYAIATTTGRLFSPFDAEGQSVYSSSLSRGPTTASRGR
jgi:hypothetical protein